MKNLTIHFKNTSAMCLYSLEMEGQISDDKYENSRPFNHWHWIGDVETAIVDGKMGIDSVGNNSRFGWEAGSKKYNLREWRSYINNWRKKNDHDYLWATRIIAYGKFGRIYSDLTWEKLQSLGVVRIFLENLQGLIEEGETNPEELFNAITDFNNYSWREKYYEQCNEFITLDFIKKFLELKYDLKELKEDINSMEMSINTNINFWKF